MDPSAAERPLIMTTLPSRVMPGADLGAGEGLAVEGDRKAETGAGAGGEGSDCGVISSRCPVRTA